MAKKASRSSRGIFVLTLFTVVALALTVKLFDIQVVQAADLNEISKDKRAVPVTIPSLRGDIVDRNGLVLATTEELYDVQLSPKNTLVRDGAFYRLNEAGTESVLVTKDEALTEIGEVTGQSLTELQKIIADALAINKESDFAYVKRSVDLDDLHKLRALGIPWITFDYNFQRKYPNGAVAGNLIGFSGYDAQPLAGVELSQDACLQGSDGYETYERGADGVALPGSYVIREKAVPGGVVQLTIDLDLQWQAQQLVDERVRALGAEWGMAIVIDTQTGELLAVAEDGSVDPGNVDATAPDKREARSFVSPYEPGSTFKTITTAALIDSGAANPSTPYDTPWTYSPEPGVQFSDWYVHGVEPWTLTGIIANSSNVGTAMLGNTLDPQTRYDYLRKFGIGESTNAGMPLEDSGLLYKAEDWDSQTKYNTAFGQGLSSTIVQAVSVFQTVANKGLRMPPALVQGCIDEDGELDEYNHGKPEQVISEKAAELTMGILESTVQGNDWKSELLIPGYRFAGKTGTGEQPDGKGGYREDYVHSFAGIFPADNPRYAVMASIAFPDVYETGTVGAINMVKEVSEITIRSMKVPHSEGEPTIFPLYY